MKSLNKFQFTLITFVVLVALFFVIFFAKKTPGKSEVADKAESNTEKVNLDQVVTKKIAALPDSLKLKFTELNKAINSNPKQISTYDSMMKFWDKLFQPDIAAFYMEKKAEISPSDSNWFETGTRFLTSVQFVKDPSLAKVLVLQAGKSFEKGLKLNPNNVEAKIKLASCYLEDEKDPMKGISLLREIEKTDSNNINLQLTFGYASFKSGQWDRAIKRFNKVLELNPEYLDAYIYLADVYERKGDKEMTIKTLEAYSKKLNNQEAKKEIEKYINKLKNS